MRGLRCSVSPLSSGANALKTSTSGVSPRAASLQALTLGVLQIARRPCLSPILKPRTGPLSKFPILHSPIGTLGAYEVQVENLHLGHQERIHHQTRTISVPHPVYTISAADPLSAPMPLTARTTSHLTLVGQVEGETRQVGAAKLVMATSCHGQTGLLQKSRSMLGTHFWMVPNHQHDLSIRIRAFPPGNQSPAS